MTLQTPFGSSETAPQLAHSKAGVFFGSGMWFLNSSDMVLAVHCIGETELFE
jgi:hypothetical protein